MKIAVGYPWSSPFVFTNFVDSILNLKAPEGCEVRYFRGSGWSPSRRHVHVCEQAIKWGADYICILGTDQVYENDMLCRLYDHVKSGRAEVISALVPVRGYVAWQPMKPFQPMAWRFKANKPEEYRSYRCMDLDGDMLEVVSPGQGLQRINFIGSGVLMFHVDHLLALKKPWFYETVTVEDQTRTANMDCTFVWRLQHEAYAFVTCDTDIKVKHSHIFDIDETYSERFADWTEPGNGNAEVCEFESIYEKQAMTLK